jgi:signal transduction histidine kinase/DNA-binding response OmpR family regulator
MNDPQSHESAAIGLSPEQFAAAFPFHLAIRRDLTVLQVGRTLRRVAPDLVPGASIAQSMDLIRPQCQLNFETIVAKLKDLFLIRHRPSGLQLRGEFVLLPEAQTLVFLASPWLTDSLQLTSFGLDLGDFAVHDPMTDLLMVMQFNKQALEDAKALNEKLTLRQAELRRANALLSLQFQVARLTSQASIPIEAAACVLEPICAALDWQCGELWVIRGSRLQFAAGWHAPAFDAEAFLKASREIDMELGSGLPGRDWSSLETAWTEDVTREPNIQRSEAAARAGLRSSVVFLIRMQSRVWGVIKLFSAKPLPPDQSFISTLTSVSGQVSQAIERLDAQEQLRVARDEAVALSVAKGKYVSTVSHEIRTPLNAVIGMTSVIKRLPMDRRLQDGIVTIENAAEQLLSIVNNVLDIERIGAGAMPLHSVNFDVHMLVAHVMQVVSALPAARSLDVVSSVDPEVPHFLLGDQGRISQILVNLMSNAVKFTERGSVRLQVSSKAEGPDRVRVRFAVQDTGKGIPRSMHEKVFEAFEQVTASSGGTGLGLTICREFANRMGGDLTLESSEGAGSTFTFSLPLQRGLQQPANEPQRVSALHALEILDSAPEPAFDELVAEAARVCEVPIALVSLVDEHRQWFKAKVGLEASQTPREQAFCAHAILTPERLMVVPDTRADPRFSGNPLVTADPWVRFYAGVPLVDAAGHALGTLCVLDRVPRELNAAQLAELQRLAGKVTALLTAGAARPLRVLVAEDTAASQLVIRLILEQQGHSVRVVGDGQQAVRAFAEEPFDLVLLDIQMPVMDGLEAARAMRRHQRGGRDLPIVGLSAFATQKDRENAIESGMTSYLVKPVRASDIATLIAQLKVRPTTSTAPAARQGAAGGDTVDEAALRQLSDDLGPEAMAAALAQFELDARAGLERLRSSAAADDGEQLRRTAHMLKGLFSLFGASAAAGRAADLEQAPGGLQAKAAQRLIELGPDAIAAVRAAADKVLAADETSLPQS